MDAAKFLAQIAQQEAVQRHSDTRKLELEQEKIEARQLDIKSKLHAARNAIERSLNFIPRAMASFYCPRCWISDGRRSVLFNVPGTATHNIMRCNECPSNSIENVRRVARVVHDHLSWHVYVPFC